MNLSYTIIRSPVDGIVGKRSVEVGQNVSIGQELVDVVPLDDVWVTANFKETQLAPYAARATRRSQGRCLRALVESASHQHGWRHGLGFQSAASGKRDR